MWSGNGNLQLLVKEELFEHEESSQSKFSEIRLTTKWIKKCGNSGRKKGFSPHYAHILPERMC